MRYRRETFRPIRAEIVSDWEEVHRNGRIEFSRGVVLVWEEQAGELFVRVAGNDRTPLYVRVKEFLFAIEDLTGGSDGRLPMGIEQFREILDRFLDLGARPDAWEDFIV